LTTLSSGDQSSSLASWERTIFRSWSTGRLKCGAALRSPRRRSRPSKISARANASGRPAAPLKDRENPMKNCNKKTGGAMWNTLTGTRQPSPRIGDAAPLWFDEDIVSAL
jgi:hypothetical protein